MISIPHDYWIADFKIYISGATDHIPDSETVMSLLCWLCFHLFSSVPLPNTNIEENKTDALNFFPCVIADAKS